MAITLSGSGITFGDSTVQATKFDTTTDKGKLLSIATFPSSATWVKPAGCTNILVKVVGGGGGASAYCESGGAGGFSEKRMDVTGISSVAVTVGGGGAISSYAGGVAGGTSSFGSYCSASGGFGSNQNFSHSGGHGGVGSGGDVNLYGGSGTGHTNTSGTGAIGNGGISYWGGNSNITGRHSNPAGTRTAAPGSGGTGGPTDNAYLGQSGMPGLIVVWEYK